jgi:hypothetical protein
MKIHAPLSATLIFLGTVHPMNGRFTLRLLKGRNGAENRRHTGYSAGNTIRSLWSGTAVLSHPASQSVSLQRSTFIGRESSTNFALAAEL